MGELVSFGNEKEITSAKELLASFATCKYHPLFEEDEKVYQRFFRICSINNPDGKLKSKLLLIILDTIFNSENNGHPYKEKDIKDEKETIDKKLEESLFVPGDNLIKDVEKLRKIYEQNNNLNELVKDSLAKQPYFNK